MRATLLGGLMLLALLAVAVVDRTGRESLLSALRMPRALAPETPATPATLAPHPDALPAPGIPPVAPVEPTAAASPPPSVLAAGELSVLEADAREPMVRYVDAGGTIRMVRGLASVPAALRADAVVLGRDNVNLVNVPAPTAVAFRDWQPDPSASRHDVVLFSAPWCGACERAKRYLDRAGVRYDERDIESDDWAKQEVVRILGQIAIPLLQVDGRYISGFRSDVYDRALQ